MDEPVSPQAEPRRTLGLRDAVALGVGGTIGGGIFVLVGDATALAGPAVLLAFALAFLASLLIALPYAELACRYPRTGGAYVYAREVLGDGWGRLTGWIVWGMYLFASAYATRGFGGYLHILAGPPPAWGAIGLILACGGINLAGVKLSGRVQVAILAFAMAGLLGFSFMGLPFAERFRFTPWMPHGYSGLLSAVLVAFLAFGGFDMVATAGGEIRNPRRNLPLAILVTLVLVLFIYLLVAVTALGTLDWRTLGASTAPLADAARTFLGKAGGRIITVLAIMTTAATTNALMAAASRVTFAMARDGLLPARLARENPTTRAPSASVLFNTLLLTLVAAADSLHIATAIGGFLYAAHFMPVLLALRRLRQTKEGIPPAFHTPFPSIVLPLAFGVALILLGSSGVLGAAGGLTWVALGLVLAWVRRNDFHLGLSRVAAHTERIDRRNAKVDSQPRSGT